MATSPVTLARLGPYRVNQVELGWPHRRGKGAAPMTPTPTPRRRNTDKDEDTRGCGWFLLLTILLGWFLVWLLGAIIHHLLSGA